MFGLTNFKGSCWVNAALQGLFASPPLRNRYSNKKRDNSNPFDVCLETVWRTNGKEGLKDLFECIRTDYMPAGDNVGDSHELIVHLCDKLKWLDDLFRFKIANKLKCKHCGNTTMKEDSVIEINLSPSIKNMPIMDTIAEYIKPSEIDGWECESCKSKVGCISQQLFGSFPKILMIHRVSMSTSMDYSSVLVINKLKYALFAVICHNGFHWWTYARHLPPGNSWYSLDDTHIKEMTAHQFPIVSTMRILLYFLIEN